MDTMTSDETTGSGNVAIDALTYDLGHAKRSRQAELKEIERKQRDIETIEASIANWDKAIADLADAIAMLEGGR